MQPDETSQRQSDPRPAPGHDEVRRFYDAFYRTTVRLEPGVSSHLRRLAARFAPWEGKQLLDVGCGTGTWLLAAADSGAIPVGIDISPVAIDICRELLPQTEFYCGPGEILPFDNGRFDAVSCLGSLEHFLDPERALREMVRVAKPAAIFIFCVPNRGFLTRRLGWYRGTHQAGLREEVRTLAGWERLFDSAGLRVTKRWRDLHPLSWSWIGQGRWYLRPVRATQAMALPFWPLSWQYQVYHLCQTK